MWIVSSSNVTVKVFADTLVEVVSVERDSVWIHDYHLLVLPSLLRKRFNRIRWGNSYLCGSIRWLHSCDMNILHTYPC